MEPQSGRVTSLKLPPLPKRDAEAWDLRVAFPKTTPIFSVSAHAGRVFVGGSKLYHLAAGDQGWQHRDPPDPIGMVWNVALEPRPPYRAALASEDGVAIMLGKRGGDRVAHIRPADEDWTVTNLAWGLVGGKSALWVLWSSGVVMRAFPDQGVDDSPGLPPMAALAGDGEGGVALFCLDEWRAYASRDGERFTLRSIDFPKDWYDALPDQIEEPCHIAVAGSAVALSIGWYGAFVTRDLAEKPFDKPEALAHAGALAFEGSSPDAALFGATCTEAFCSIVRVDAAGNAVRVGDIMNESGPVVPLDEIAWDASRRRLFGVHRQAGLLVATAPQAKHGKLPAAN
jgi:hypothetical protein